MSLICIFHKFNNAQALHLESTKNQAVEDLKEWDTYIGFSGSPDWIYHSGDQVTEARIFPVDNCILLK